jgi:hypothetical protein
MSAEALAGAAPESIVLHVSAAGEVLAGFTPGETLPVLADGEMFLLYELRGAFSPNAPPSPFDLS